MSIDTRFKDFLNEKSSAEIINPEKKVPNPKGGKPPRKTQFRNGNNANPDTNGEFKQPGNGENGEEEPNGEFKPERKKPVVVTAKKKRPKNDIVPTKKEVDKVIDCDPKFNALPEATSVASAVFTFGRMNPPTIGHDKLVKKVFKEAKKSRGTPYIYLSHSEGKKTDPIPYKHKVRYAQKAWGGSVVESRARTIIQILQEIAKAGHKSVTMVVGSDRVRDFDRILKKYNGKDYTFENVNVVSAGQRDPDAEGAAGMSASKMRELASDPKAKDYKERIVEFKKGLPRKLQRDFLMIARHIKEEFEVDTTINLLFEEYVINDEDLLDISEEEYSSAIIEAEQEEDYDEEQLDEVLTMQQRRKRALMLKRMMPRIIRARKLKKNRMATPEMLRRRSLRAARTIIRRKIIGAKGANYSKLSTSMKIQLDKRVAQKQKIIQRIAKRLAPKIRQAEMVRLRNAKSGGAKKGAKKKTPAKIMTTNESIINKAAENDISVNELFEQYQLGREEPHGQQTPEQGGFARMAHFITEISVDKATGRKAAGTWGRTSGGYSPAAAKQSKRAGSKGARKAAKLSVNKIDKNMGAAVKDANARINKEDYNATQDAIAHAKKDGANYHKDVSVQHKYDAYHMKKAGYTHRKYGSYGSYSYNKHGDGNKIKDSDHHGVHEEVVSEISPQLKKRYISKAQKDITGKEKAKLAVDTGKAAVGPGPATMKQVTKRREGIRTARANLEDIERDSDKKRIKVKGPDGRTIWKNVRRETDIERNVEEGIISGTGKAIGWTAKKAVQGGKWAAKRSSASGRADAADAKHKKMQKQQADNERRKKAKAGISKIRKDRFDSAKSSLDKVGKRLGLKEYGEHEAKKTIEKRKLIKKMKATAPFLAKGLKEFKADGEDSKIADPIATKSNKRKADKSKLDPKKATKKQIRQADIKGHIGEGDEAADKKNPVAKKHVGTKEWKALHDMDDSIINDYVKHKEVKQEGVLAQFEPEYSEKKRELSNILRKKVGLKTKPKLDWKKKRGLSDATDPEFDRLKGQHKSEKERVKDTHTKELERLKMRKSRNKIRATSKTEMVNIINDVDMLMEALNLDERIEKEREAEYDVTLSKKVNQLLRMGLADKGELQTYQRALRGGQDSLKNPKLRKKLHQLLAKLLSIIETNPAAFIKIRAEVQKGKSKGELDPNRFVDA